MERRLVTFLIFVLVLGFAGVAVADTGGSVEQAYKREFAFLDAEKNTLKKRIAEGQAEAKQKIAEAEAEIAALQSQVMGVSLQADKLGDTLAQTEMEAAGAGEGDDVIDGILQQMATALEKGNLKLPEVKKDDETAVIGQVSFGFDKGLELLRQYGSIRKTEGDFFLANGKQEHGTILRVGNVAAYGISDAGAGALAPAGGDRLKIWPANPSGDVARSLLQGETPSTLKLFLFESLEKNVDAKKDKTALQVIEDGGEIGWVIVGLGVVAAIMILLRAIFLWTAAANTDKLVEELTPLLEKGSIEQAIAICAKTRGAAGRVLKQTLRHLDSDREHLEDVISESVMHEQPFLDRFGSLILVVAAVAPLLGLLGTVTGMIATFDVITEYGTGNPKLLSGGISIALITTELGLIVAIPALLFGNLLKGWAESIKDAIDKAALRVTNIANGVKVAQSVRPPPDTDGVLAPAAS